MGQTSITHCLSQQSSIKWLSSSSLNGSKSLQGVVLSPGAARQVLEEDMVLQNNVWLATTHRGQERSRWVRELEDHDKMSLSNEMLIIDATKLTS